MNNDIFSNFYDKFYVPFNNSNVTDLFSAPGRVPYYPPIILSAIVFFIISGFATDLETPCSSC